MQNIYKVELKRLMSKSQILNNSNLSLENLFHDKTCSPLYYKTFRIIYAFKKEEMIINPDLDERKYWYKKLNRSYMEVISGIIFPVLPTVFVGSYGWPGEIKIKDWRNNSFGIADLVEYGSWSDFEKQNAPMLINNNGAELEKFEQYLATVNKEKISVQLIRFHQEAQTNLKVLLNEENSKTNAERVKEAKQRLTKKYNF